MTELADGAKGEGWCLFEFVRPGDKKTESLAEASSAKVESDSAEDERRMPPAQPMPPVGLGGFSFNIQANGKKVKIILSDYFGIGILPSGFGERIQGLVREALTGSRCQWDGMCDAPSLYEMDLSAGGMALAGVKELPVGLNAPQVLAVLDAGFSKGQWTVHRGKNTWILDYAGESKDLLHGNFRQNEVTMAVLESREMAGSLGYIDRFLVEGRSDLAYEACLREAKAAPRNMFVTRRLALVCLSPGMLQALLEDREWPLLADAVEADAKELLFSSVQINRLLRFGPVAAGTSAPQHAMALLDTLSILGTNLGSRIENSDSLASFELVLPELLGDQWLLVDRDKARSCYERITARRGALPRILWKLVKLARQIGDELMEYTCLGKLLESEQRSGDLAEVYYRLAQIVDAKDPSGDEGVANALKALDQNAGHSGAALLAASILERQHRHEAAVSVLDQFLKGNRDTISSGNQASIEFRIGEIWHVKLLRDDLAEVRYLNALRLDPDQLEVLYRVRDIYRQGRRYDALMGIYEQLIAVHETAGNKLALRETFEDLVKLMRVDLKDKARLASIYTRVGKSLILTHAEIDDVLGLPAEELREEWKAIFEALRNKVVEMSAGPDRAKYLARLGLISRDKLADPIQARKFFVDAVADGAISDAEFVYLQEELLRSRDFDVLAICLEQYASFAEPIAARQALVDLLALPDVVSDVKKDQVAVRAWGIDRDSELVIHQRLQCYKRLGYAEGLQRILDLIWKEPVPDFSKEHWAKRVGEIAADMKDDDRFTLLEEVFRRRLLVSQDRSETLAEAVLQFKSSGRSEILRTFAVGMLDAGLIPPLELSHAEELFREYPREKARIYLSIARNSAEGARAVEMAQQALAIFRDELGEKDGIEEALSVICSQGENVDSDLQRLREMVGVSGHWALLGTALKFYAARAEDKERKLQLLMELGRVHFDHTRDLAQSKQAFEEALSCGSGNPETYWELAQVSHAMGDFSSERDRYLSFLALLSRFDPIERLELAIRRLSEMEGTEVNLFLTLCRLVPLAISGRRAEVLAMLSNKIMYMGGIATHSRINQYLEIGKCLADSDNFRSRAIVFYKEAIRLDQEDDRVWMPLYFLLRESGGGDERLQHLRLIVPRLEQDRKSLKAYPITLETLKRDLDELERGYGFGTTQQLAGAASSGFGGDSVALNSRNNPAESLGPIRSKPAFIEAAAVDVDEDESWRDALLRPSLTLAQARSLCERAFTSDMEKHLAIQGLSLRTGDVETLKAWTWPVWSDVSKFSYLFLAKERLPDGATPAALKTPLGKLVVAIAPLLARRFRSKFSIDELAKRLKISKQGLIQSRRPLSWTSSDAKSFGLFTLRSRLEKNRISLCGIDGLGAEMFYDSTQRTLYLDFEHFRTKGSSVLLHRVNQEYWSLKMQYFVPLALDPIRAVFPTILQIRRVISETGIGRWMTMFRPGMNDLTRGLLRMNQEMLRELLHKVGPIEQGALIEVWEAMRLHLCRVDMADTLDIVGILSLLSGTDLGSIPPQRLQETIQKSPEIASLLEFAAKIRVNG